MKHKGRSRRSFSPRPSRATAWARRRRRPEHRRTSRRKMDLDALKDNSGIVSIFRSRTRRSRTCRITSPRRKGRNRVPARASQSAWAAPARGVRKTASHCRCRRLRPSRRSSRVPGDREIIDHDGLRPHADDAAPKTSRSARTSCRSCPTRRARSAWKACSARLAFTLRKGSCTRRRMPDQLMYYREDKKGQILEEGINEGGAILLVDRGRHVLQQSRRADDAVLHLLLDVRLPAHRRLYLGRR